MDEKDLPPFVPLGTFRTVTEYFTQDRLALRIVTQGKVLSYKTNWKCDEFCIYYSTMRKEPHNCILFSNITKRRFYLSKIQINVSFLHMPINSNNYTLSNGFKSSNYSIIFIYIFYLIITHVQSIVVKFYVKSFKKHIHGNLSCPLRTVRNPTY